MYCCTCARTRTRVYVPGGVAAAWCMMYTAVQWCVAAAGRKPHAAAVVITPCSRNSGVSLLLAVGTPSCLCCCCCCCLLHVSLLLYTAFAALLVAIVCCLLHCMRLMNTACCLYTSTACCRLLYVYEDDLLPLPVCCGTWGHSGPKMKCYEMWQKHVTCSWIVIFATKIVSITSFDKI